jgi:signal peptidase I
MSTIQQVARELGMTSQEVIARLKAMGQPADSHLSPVDQTVADRLRRESASNGPRGGNGALTASAGAPFDVATDQTVVTREPVADEAPVTDAPSQGGGEPPDDEPSTKESAEQEGPPKKSKTNSVLRQVAELPVLIVLAFGIAVIIKVFLVQAFFIPSASMNPTLVKGDRVLVEKIGYRIGEPKRGQVIVFAQETAGERPDLPWSEDVRNFFRELIGLPTGEETDFIKRVVAVGGDVITYQGNSRKLVVNGERVDEPYIKGGQDTASTKISRSNCKSMQLEADEGGCRIPAGSVFVMGDNRGNSMDSRVFGPVKEGEIVGRAWIIIWPPEDFGTL